jgi:hypothetical protein
MTKLILILTYYVSLTISGVLNWYKICSRHDIAEILLKLALNINQLINAISELCKYAPSKCKTNVCQKMEQYLVITNKSQ